MTPEQYLDAIPYDEWKRFDSIPDDIWLSVFELIDMNYVNTYWTNDDDTEFMKISGKYRL